MKPYINEALIKSKKKRKDLSGDTAYYIFDRDNILPFKVSIVHHRMKYGSMDDPILGLTRSQVDEHSKQMISVHAPLIQVIDYFIAGASLEISPDTMLIMYERIDDHINAHMKAMRTDTGYYIGDTFTLFEEMVEFARHIYPRIKETRDKKLDSVAKDDPLKAMTSGRANFMTMVTRSNSQVEVKDSKSKEDILVCPLVDKLERMRDYYESSQSWRQEWI